jgi:class 3 adenylate cyclase/tetratricopeptide (TPR) repeat protein
VDTDVTTTRDRRQITVLFFDLVDATAWSERLDPEDLRDLLQRLHAICETAVGKYEGHIAQHLGDGVLSYFGYPLAFEDSARRAVEAGLAILQEVRRCAHELLPRLGGLIQGRIGIDTGSVVFENVGTADRPEVLAIGEAPNRAARVQGEAVPDSLVVSETTFRLTKGYFRFVDLGARPLKGFSQPVQLHAVGEATDARSRLDTGAADLTPFVDRREHLAFLADRWEETKQGAAPIVLLSGDAGIGKSRLIRAFRESLDPGSALFVTCYCSSFFQSSALWPIIDMLDRRLSGDGGPEAKRERLRAELASLGLATREAVSLLASLLSLPVASPEDRVMMTPQRERQETFQALFTWLMRLTRTQPVMLLIEDLHWADPSTLEFLSLVADRTPTGPLMVVLTHRPEFVPPWQGSRIHPRVLGRLERPDAEAILHAVAGDDALSGELVSKLLTRADGVPLYLEEITKAVVESSGRAPVRPEASRDPAIPATLQDSLAARLDRLGTSKTVAQLAATLGRTFEFKLLHVVSGMSEDALRAELDRLVAAELLYRRGTPPNESFIFKHALIQDAAYESLLRRTRQQYHLAIVEALIAHLPDTAQAHPELLAHHYAGAGLPREAIEKWTIAGQRAMVRSAFTEAAVIFSRALSELPALSSPSERDQTEIVLRSGLGLALISTRGWAVPEVEQNYARTLQLCESFGNVPVQVLYGIWGVHLVRGDQEGSERLAAVFRELLTRSDDLRTRVAARSVLGAFAFYQGRYPEAVREFSEARAIAQRSSEFRSSVGGGSQDYGLDAYLYSELYLPHVLQSMGSLVEAESSWRDTLAWIESTRHPFMIATVLAYGVVLAVRSHDAVAAGALSGRLAHLSVENGFHYWLAIARSGGGWAAAQSSAGPDGLSEIEQGVATLRYLGAFIVVPHFASYLAEACLLKGDLARAGQVTDDALSVIEGRLCRNHEAPLLALKGEILARGGNTSKAAAVLEKAIEIGTTGGDMMATIDAALSLGRISADPAAARAVAVRLRQALAKAADGATHPRFESARQWLAQHD